MATFMIQPLHFVPKSGSYGVPFSSLVFFRRNRATLYTNILRRHAFLLGYESTAKLAESLVTHHIGHAMSANLVPLCRVAECFMETIGGVILGIEMLPRIEKLVGLPPLLALAAAILRLHLGRLCVKKGVRNGL